MKLIEIQSALASDIERQLVHPSILLNNLRVISEGSRQTSAYVDPRYFPFYYHLGKYIQAKNLLEIGFGLGFFSTCYLKSCKTTENFLAFQEENKTFYSNKLAIKNVKSVFNGNLDYYFGKINDVDFQKHISSKKWNLVLFNMLNYPEKEQNYDNYILHFDIVWEHLESDGYMVIDYVNSDEKIKQVFNTFCKMHNADHITLPTRYGVGIIQK